MRQVIVSAIKREKNIFSYVNNSVKLVLNINCKSLKTMEAVPPYTTRVMPSLKPVNFN